MQPGKAEIVDVLVARGLDLRRRGDHHRARAYLRAANGLARRADLAELVQGGRLQEVAGVGPAIAAVVARFVETGERPRGLPSAEDSVRALARDLEVPAGWTGGPLAGAPDLHCHTTWSDGTMALDELAAYADRLGARVLGVSDHSGTLRIARGLAPDEVRAQWADIARVQRAHPGLRILRGTECDILLDGALDHPREILQEFDFVIGSLHSKLRAPEEVQTARVLAALGQEHLTIFGHPTTRVPGRRPPANLDLPRVFRAAADAGVALEVNGNPGRLDLDARLAAQALAAGARLSLGSDAHYPRELLGLAEARRMAHEAGARAADVVNFDFLAREAPAR